MPVKSMPNKRSIPAVRGTSSESASAGRDKKTVITNTGGGATSPAGEEKTNSNGERLGEADFRGWEKFDADAAVDAVDGDDMSKFDISKINTGELS